MAYDYGFKVQGLAELDRMLRTTGDKMRLQMSKLHRFHAGRLRNLIKAKAPRTGASGAREGPRHDTRHGAIKRDTKSRASSYYAKVTGGGPRSPHYTVHEYGGGVWWTKAGGGGRGRAMFGHLSSRQIGAKLASRGVNGHYIESKPRSASFAVSPLKHGASGHFFWPTVRKEMNPIVDDYWDELCKLVAAKMKTI